MRLHISRRTVSVLLFIFISSWVCYLLFRVETTFSNEGNFRVHEGGFRLLDSYPFSVARCLSRRSCSKALESSLGKKCVPSSTDTNKRIAVFALARHDSPGALHIGHAANLIKFMLDLAQTTQHIDGQLVAVTMSRKSTALEWFNHTMTTLFGGFLPYYYTADTSVHWPFFTTLRSYLLEARACYENGTDSVRFSAINLNGEVDVCYDRVLFPTFNFRNSRFDIPNLEYIHRRFFTSNNVTACLDDKRNANILYLYRQPTNRGVANDLEMIQCLRNMSHRLTVHEKASPKDVYNADIVIGMHGAAMMNTIFMKQGAALIEMFPMNIGDRNTFELMIPTEWRHYVSWQNTNASNHIWLNENPSDNDTQTYISCDIVKTLVKTAKAKIPQCRSAK